MYVLCITLQKAGTGLLMTAIVNPVYTKMCSWNVARLPLHPTASTTTSYRILLQAQNLVRCSVLLRDAQGMVGLGFSDAVSDSV